MLEVLFSAELRWFFKGPPPAALDSWFRSGHIPPGGGEIRRDEYLRDPKQQQLGVKKRGRNPGVEIKGLVGERVRDAKPFAGQLQFWTKWMAPTLSIDHLPQIVVEKRRWLRKFDADGEAVRELRLGADERPVDAPQMRPTRGCGVELVSLTTSADAAIWWTFAFEAFGPQGELERTLERTIARLPLLDASPFMQGRELSYPTWLSTLDSA